MIPTDWLAEAVNRHGMGLGLFAVFAGGLLLNLTPCVYPMIPVTLAFFTRQSEGSIRRTVWLAAVYAAGLALSYAVLGAVASRTGALFGSWLQSPLVVLSMVTVIVALSLSMFGFYELRPPSFIMQRLGKASTGSWGALLMGMTVGIVAAPCVGPFIVSLMLVVGRMADPSAGFILFFVLGFGMGLPSVLLAVAAQRARHLPKAGQWLIWVKKGLGVVLLAVAFWFARPLLPAGMGWPRTSSKPSVAWQPYTQTSLDAAKAAGRPAVIDIYADWCLPCVELDHVTFRHPEVVSAMQSVAALRVDVTHKASMDAEALFSAHNVYGVPTVLLFDAAGRERTDLRVTGFTTPEQFLQRLKQLQGH